MLKLSFILNQFLSHTHTRTHARPYGRTRAHIDGCIHAHKHLQRHMPIYIHIRICMSACICTHTHTQARAHTHIHTRRQFKTLIHVCTHTNDLHIHIKQVNNFTSNKHTHTEIYIFWMHASNFLSMPPQEEKL